MNADAKKESIRRYRGTLIATDTAGKVMSEKELEQALIESIIKQVEVDYAVQYLESVGVSSNQANVTFLLDNYPLSKCELESSGWDVMTEMVDTISITPVDSKSKRNFFDYFKEKLFNKNSADSDDEPEKFDA